MYKISVEESLKVGWQNTRTYGGTIFGALVVYFLISLPLIFIPTFYFMDNLYFKFYSNVISILFFTPLAAGGCFIVIKMYRGPKPEFGALFEGFKRYTPLVIVGLIFTIGFEIIYLPTTLYESLIASDDLLNPGPALNLAMMSMVNSLVYFLIVIRFSFASFIIMDDNSITAIQALKKSWDLVNGNYVYLIVYSIAIFILIVIGFIFLIIPGIVLSLIAYISFGFIYLRLLDNYNTANNIPYQQPPFNPPPPLGQTPPPPLLPNDQKPPDHPYGQ